MNLKLLCVSLLMPFYVAANSEQAEISITGRLITQVCEIKDINYEEDIEEESSVENYIKVGMVSFSLKCSGLDKVNVYPITRINVGKSAKFLNPESDAEVTLDTPHLLEGEIEDHLKYDVYVQTDTEFFDLNSIWVIETL